MFSTNFFLWSNKIKIKKLKHGVGVEKAAHAMEKLYCLLDQTNKKIK